MISLSKAASISELKILTLREDFRPTVCYWLEEALKAGINPYIYEGFRSRARQDELYAIGRTAPGKIVTQAKAGQSFHNYGLAFDWVPLRLVEKADGMYEADWDNKSAYNTGAKIAAQLRLRSLSWETPHLEDARFANWRELAAHS